MADHDRPETPRASTFGMRDAAWEPVSELTRRVALAANAALTTREAIVATADAVVAVTGWPVALVWQVEPDPADPRTLWLRPDDRLAPAEEFTTLLDQAKPVVTARAGAVGAVATTGTSGAVWHTTEAATPLDAAAAQAGLTASAAFPVMAHGQTQLVLQFLFDGEARPSRPLLAAMETVCRQLARVVERAEPERAPTGLRRTPGLVARQVFLDRLAHELTVNPASLVVARVGLDRYVRIGEWLGPAIAEDLLHRLVARLVAVLDDPAMVTLDGDEMFLLALRASDAEVMNPLSLGWRLIDAVSAPFKVGHRDIAIGLSVGLVAAGQLPHADPEQLVRAADGALQEVLVRGSRRVGVFDPARGGFVGRQAELDADLFTAITHGQLEVHYQPTVALPSGRLGGMEALVRWQHPTLGFVAPGEFIPEAERSGLIRQIGQHVLTAACRQAGRWPAGLDVAVNLSPTELEDPALVGRVGQVLAGCELSPGRLVLEVTETAMSHDPATADRRLGELRELGVQIALDDFGSGYASIERLRAFGFDQVKLDRSLVQHATTARSLMLAAVEMAHTLGMRVVAEGVETPEQLAIVLELGCDQAQGYLFAPPLPPDRLERLLDNPTWDLT